MPPARRAPRAQVWRERLLPRLEGHLAEALDSVAAYQLVYHEAALANLLEVGAAAGCCPRWVLWSNIGSC